MLREEMRNEWERVSAKTKLILTKKRNSGNERR